MNRTCGACSECCSRLPVKELAKGANERCRHQRFSAGCKIHGKPKMPVSCRSWSCKWLVDGDTAALSRPDRSGYVLDIAPDFISIRDNDTGEVTDLQVIQVWCDPKRRDSHRDPKLREYLSRRADEGICALIRYSANDAFVLAAPKFTGGDWQEIHSNMRSAEHTPQQIAEALGVGYEVRDLREKPL